MATGWTKVRAFTASDLVHPFEAGGDVALMPGLIGGKRLDRRDIVAALRRVCAFFGLREPRVYVSPLPGHAHAPGALRLAEQSLAELAPDELEALLAHLCGHLVLPGGAGELSADRAAAFYYGSADVITRVIFAESTESTESAESAESAESGESGGDFRDRDAGAARTDPYGLAVHSGRSPEDLAVRVREIQAWTATAGFARLVSPGRGRSAALPAPV